MLKKLISCVLTLAVVLSLAFSADAAFVSQNAHQYAKFDYTLDTADGNALTSADMEGYATVVVFFSRNDNNGFLMLDDIQCSDWISEERVRVVAAETSGMKAQELLDYQKNYGFSDITFCSDEDSGDYAVSVKALSESENTVKSPVTVLLDQDCGIRQVFTGYQKPDYLKTFVESYAQAPEAPEKPRQSAGGLLIWDKVDGAYGYEIYRADRMDGEYDLAGSTKATIWSDPEAEGGQVYYYKVKALQLLNSIQVASDFSAAVKVNK